MSTYVEPRSSGTEVTIPLLKLVECVPPSVAEIVRAADSAEEPRFLLRLNRPLNADERRVVALELPNATLHDENDPYLTLSVHPDHVIERPQALQSLVQGISSVTTTMRRAEVELLAECEDAAVVVNEMLNPTPAEAPPGTAGEPIREAGEPIRAASERPTPRARRRRLRA